MPFLFRHLFHSSRSAVLQVYVPMKVEHEELIVNRNERTVTDLMLSLPCYRNLNFSGMSGKNITEYGRFRNFARHSCTQAIRILPSAIRTPTGQLSVKICGIPAINLTGLRSNTKSDYCCYWTAPQFHWIRKTKCTFFY